MKVYICNYKIYSNFKNCLYDGIAGLCCNTAGIVHVPSHLDVSLLAPGHPPAILHNPVVLQTSHINNTIQLHSPPLWIVILHSLTQQPQDILYFHYIISLSTLKLNFSLTRDLLTTILSLY